MKIGFNLASLPPTQAAARHHSLRTYHQIQLWIGNEKNPLHWGWKISKYGLLPITTNKDPAPQSVLNTVSCKCTKRCKGSCSCRKLGMTCSSICFNCKGQACTNRNIEDDLITDGNNFSIDEEFDKIINEWQEKEEEAEEKEEGRHEDKDIYGPSTSKILKKN